MVSAGNKGYRGGLALRLIFARAYKTDLCGAFPTPDGRSILLDLGGLSRSGGLRPRPVFTANIGSEPVRSARGLINRSRLNIDFSAMLFLETLKIRWATAPK